MPNTCMPPDTIMSLLVLRCSAREEEGDNYYSKYVTTCAILVEPHGVPSQ